MTSSYLPSVCSVLKGPTWGRTKELFTRFKYYLSKMVGQTRFELATFRPPAAFFTCEHSKIHSYIRRKPLGILVIDGDYKGTKVFRLSYNQKFPSISLFYTFSHLLSRPSAQKNKFYVSNPPPYKCPSNNILINTNINNRNRHEHETMEQTYND